MPIAKSVRRLEPYVPGEQPKSASVVKLNTNENPYPPSPACAAALASFDIGKLRKYPDPVFLELRKAIARRNKCSVEQVFVGNGSDEILALAAKAFVENDGYIASLDPSYSLYKTIAAIRDVRWEGPDKAKKSALMLWTNPNAPTGTFAEPAEIEKFARNYKGVLIVDEAYADFARANSMRLALSPGNTNTIVMRTFSKSYSLAGLRVGYAVGPASLIEALYKVKDSYNVDAIAQAVALAAYNDQKWMRANAAKIRRTRKAFAASLVKRGWDVMPSESNFVFARPPRGNAAEIFAALKKRGIYVRYFPAPATKDRLRITIGTDEQMKKLLEALDAL
ncbi:MAG: histidinol-phosphate transaminase [Kiritimatiellae bacterium]|nr:histidinol-phosphate transaminase [Kiritimatiellia bacterium]